MTNTLHGYADRLRVIAAWADVHADQPGRLHVDPAGASFHMSEVPDWRESTQAIVESLGGDWSIASTLADSQVLRAENVPDWGRVSIFIPRFAVRDEISVSDLIPAGAGS